MASTSRSVCTSNSGGKAPVTVFRDADLGAMAHAVALGATYNTGQDCTAAARVYLER